MLQIQDLTYRIQGRALFDGASAQIASGWKVGFVGRNGSGKSTLMRLIEETRAGAGEEAIRISRGARLGFVAQEAAASDDPLIEVVLAADEERASLLQEADAAIDPTRIAEIHTRLFDIDAHSAEARAAEILTGLGFSSDELGRPMREFSGGWRMRAALAGVLFSTPDLLLLDEPTNYLDLEGAAWLEAYLRKYPKTVLIVSHDRELLNRSVTHILALEKGKLSVQAGGYDAYLKRRAERAAHLEAQREKQAAQRAHLQSFVDRFRAKASKARQAQSRIKMLERMQDVSVPLVERTLPFRLDDPEPLASPILEIENAALGYDAGRPILSGVHIRLDQEDRIAIVGANGQGKTTLVKSIAERLPLLAGRRHAVRALRIGYFSQDQLDELRAGENVLDHVRPLSPLSSNAQVRAMAAQMGFGPEKVETPVEQLSGGEKVRLLIGLTAWKRPHILILDEPTSHLDIDSREALIYALNAYRGAVLLITHDAWLAEACADRLWLVRDGRVRPYDGDLADYRALVLAADRTRTADAPARRGAVAEPSPRSGPEAARPPAAGPSQSGRKASHKVRRRAETAEREVDRLKTELAAVDADLARPDAFTDPAAGEGRLRRRAGLQAALDAAEAEWLDAMEELEAGGG